MVAHLKKSKKARFEARKENPHENKSLEFLIEEISALKKHLNPNESKKKRKVESILSTKTVNYITSSNDDEPSIFFASIPFAISI